MRIEVIKREENVLEFYLEGEDHTFANLLNEVLHENEHVTFAGYTIEHPVLMARKPKFRVVTDGKITPEQVLEEAAQKIFDRARAVLEAWKEVLGE
ncbi:DNA-directed RNA polymerase, subunit L [Thermococcus onnurineus NA1]|uniref:DNA-directed RNA polymerase subunit Rpo11 n=1 Tax=Thermococcus onnurineus (strain NA1) TaxID=523850 RepID=RPO11_THEON|nr:MULTISPECIES: DNA-directed RNA polymerase subunit L [Thermococcus]B6YTH7.1 RecName: Full=DNA-directed RNA polymerase subunit Rpo11; AltName: Full=DNA-directed RNA polymerase subunit L [Thermococcus onnurineus NA1]ACJ15864.1 DNA-directed RNA polymerase, subunit L [Thermococcus onnurineus NA1]NJE46361.1 DNA-directed RNA polymerase subunit L [Thermococcus sp. GR7]NJE77720.1 DNA-directed RNA polymerase subunit L [Thermococcus sp. GR4]NJF23759.1 DNA-directed RNA polymerase subunit L [Thermococcu